MSGWPRVEGYVGTKFWLFICIGLHFKIRIGANFPNLDWILAEQRATRYHFKLVYPISYLWSLLGPVKCCRGVW